MKLPYYSYESREWAVWTKDRDCWTAGSGYLSDCTSFTFYPEKKLLYFGIVGYDDHDTFVLECESLEDAEKIRAAADRASHTLRGKEKDHREIIWK